MNNLVNLSSEDLHLMKELNDKLIDEEKTFNPDNEKILKIKQQILMKGIEMFAGFNPNKYNPY